MTSLSFAAEWWCLPKLLVILICMTDNETEQLARFGQIVKQRREQLGLRQDQLAERGGPSTTTLTKVENGSPPPPTPVTLRKLDAGLGWDAGSAADVLTGGTPRVSGERRARDGRLIERFIAIEGAEQPGLERVRLAAIVADVRDLLREEVGPRMKLLARQLDEGVELAIRAVAREGDNDIEDGSYEHAQWVVGEERATNSIQRIGAIYVINEQGAVGERSTTDSTATSRASSEAHPDEKNRADNVRTLIPSDPAPPLDSDRLAADTGEVGHPDIPAVDEGPQVSPDEHGE